jgi:hypothetical protein
MQRIDIYQFYASALNSVTHSSEGRINQHLSHNVEYLPHLMPDE